MWLKKEFSQVIGTILEMIDKDQKENVQNKLGHPVHNSRSILKEE